MKISKQQATAICCEVIKALENWPALPAALQSGGLEEKATSRITLAIEKWLASSSSQLLVLPQYGKIDFALVNQKSVLGGELRVDTVIEVKFNYATQARPQIQTRLPRARAQALNYLTQTNAKNAYVLYFVAAPCIHQLPPAPLDSGWRYWCRSDAMAAMREAIKAIGSPARSKTSATLGEALNSREPLLYCALIRV